MYKLSNNPNVIIRTFDNCLIPKLEDHPDYLLYLEWIDKGNQPLPADITVPTHNNPKLIGIEFEGVMCSATKADQDGLLAILVSFQMQGEMFTPTRFDFANGNKLVLHKDNIQQFMQVWMPFRQSFFSAETP